jgi:pimeloyl-ACP methyl ester carboxylesterase
MINFTKTLLIIILITASSPVYSQTTPISTLRMMNANGSPIGLNNMYTVTGTVISSHELGNAAAIQDGTGGITVYDTLFANMTTIGDLVIVSGKLTQYAGLAELTAPITFTKVSSGHAVSPILLTIPQIKGQAWNGFEAYESSFIKIKNVTINGTGTFTSITTGYPIVNGTDVLTLYCNKYSTLLGSAIPTGNVDVEGILNQFKSVAPYNSGYEIIPRTVGDICTSSIITYPKISLNVVSINSGQSITITGSDFSPSSTANIYFTGTSNVTIPTSIITTSSTGEINYNFNSTLFAPGNYSVIGYDIASNNYTTPKSFEILSNEQVVDYLKVTSPTIGADIYPCQDFIVSWTDKMFLSSSYQTMGASRKYKYYIELSSNGGSTWTLNDSLEGLGRINEFVNLNKRLSITQPGQNYKIQIIDYYDLYRNDASSIFTVLNQTINNIKADYIWDYSYENRNGNPMGCAADGISRIYLRLYKINKNIGLNISNAEFSLNDGTSDLKTNGKLKIATNVKQWDDEANGANLLSVSVPLNSAINDTFWVWYVAPDDFVREAFNDDKNSGLRDIQLTIKVIYSDNTFEFIPVNPIKIYRPPLMLVYGLGDNTGLWDNYPLKTTYNNLFPSISTPPIGNNDHYDYNAKGLLKLNNSLMGFTFEDVIAKTREDKQIACNQLYYIGHSMGGLIPRVCESSSLTNSYKTIKNYNQGYINKLITIDTPHNGSPWADYLSNLYSITFDGLTTKGLLRLISAFPGHYFNAFFDLLGQNGLSPAANDLRINGGVTFEASSIKANAIVGDIIDGNEPDINNIDNSIISQLNYKIKPLYLFLLDQYNNFPIYMSYKNYFKKVDGNLINYNNHRNFIANSDFIVSALSQRSGLDETSPNITSISGCFHSKSTGLPDVVTSSSDKVLKVLNSSSILPIWGYFPPTSVCKTLFSSNIKTNKILELDSTFVSVEPVPFSAFQVNSSYNISFGVTDTAGLSNVGVIFQSNSYQTAEKTFSYQFSIQTDGNYLDTQKVLIYAYYQRGDSVLLATQEIPVIVTTDETIHSFQVSPKVFIMRGGDKTTPSFKGVFNTFLSDIGDQGTTISAIVEDPNIVKFNSADKEFEAVGYGETSAIVSYRGLSDTVYFAINGADDVLPVELSSFTLNITGRNVQLKWGTMTEKNSDKFEIEQSFTSMNNWIKTGSVKAENLSNSPKQYSFKVNNLQSGRYYFRLKLIDNDGSFAYSKIIEADINIPTNFELSQNYPNPFNPTTVIKYSIPADGLVNISLYNMLGERVKEIVNGFHKSGYYTINFNASSLASGVYFYRLNSGGKEIVKKMMVLK